MNSDGKVGMVRETGRLCGIVKNAGSRTLNSAQSRFVRSAIRSLPWNGRTIGMIGKTMTRTVTNAGTRATNSALLRSA